jgi:hypothetical protein
MMVIIPVSQRVDHRIRDLKQQVSDLRGRRHHTVSQSVSIDSHFAISEWKPFNVPYVPASEGYRQKKDIVA